MRRGRKTPTVHHLPVVVLSCLLAACGGAGAPAEDVRWTLDTSSWPDCGWTEHHMVYTTGADVRVHDLVTGDDRQVWSDAALRTLAEIDNLSRPAHISLAGNRRWMSLSLLPNAPSGPQLFAVSCDGKTAQRIGPQKPYYIGGAIISPDGQWMSLGYRWTRSDNPETAHAPDGDLLLNLKTGKIRKYSDYGHGLAWSGDSKLLLYTTSDGIDEIEHPFHLAILSVDGSQPDWRSTRNFNWWRDCAWDGTSDFAYCTGLGGTTRWPFDDNKAPEEIADVDLGKLGLAADGTLYGLYHGPMLHEVDIAKGELISRWSQDLPPISEFSF